MIHFRVRQRRKTYIPWMMDNWRLFLTRRFNIRTLRTEKGKVKYSGYVYVVDIKGVKGGQSIVWNSRKTTFLPTVYFFVSFYNEINKVYLHFINWHIPHSLWVFFSKFCVRILVVIWSLECLAKILSTDTAICFSKYFSFAFMLHHRIWYVGATQY